MGEQLEMIATTHESISALLHAIDPAILIEIACAAAGIVVVELVQIRNRNPRLETPAQSKRALGIVIDIVYSVLSADGQRVVESWIFEVEVSFDLDKIWTWALYEIAVDAEYKAMTRVAVFSPDPGLRERIRTRIIPRMKTEPIVIERDQIERITDYEDARRRPELAILGCLFHAHEPASFEDRVEVFRAAWVAIQSLEKDRGQRYAVAVMRIVASDVIDQGITELREQDELVDGRWVRFSDIERKGWSFTHGHEEGREEGREEGQREQLRRSIVDICELRGFVLSPAQRERIAACESLETLERWYTAAKTAAQGVDPLVA